MRVSTAEFPDEVSRYEEALGIIASHVEIEKPDLLVLPEMPFAPWVFHTDKFDQVIWDKTVADHEYWLAKLILQVPTPIISSRPTNVNGKRLNQAFYVDDRRALHPLRSKYYLPNDYPATEVPWFDIGDKPGEVFELNGLHVGVQLCSEIMYAETPRHIGAKGAHILVQSRATGAHSRWRAAAVLGATTSGAFVIASNRRSVKRDWFTGGSWVYSPAGELLAETTDEVPIKTVTVDISLTTAMKTEYPFTMFDAYRDYA